MLDAELALKDSGRPSFQLLQQSRRNRAPVVVYVFDLLTYRGRDLKQLSLRVRRAELEQKASKFPDHVLLSELLPEEAQISGLWPCSTSMG